LGQYLDWEGTMVDGNLGKKNSLKLLLLVE